MAQQTRAERNIKWCEDYLRIPEGQFVGQPLKMAEYMKDDFRAIYDNPFGTRRAIISRGRKNAKTTETAMILLLHICGPEAKPNGQLFSAAQSRDQAAILFALAAKMVRMNPALDANQGGVVGIRDTAKQIYCEELGTIYKALSADAATAYGLSPVLIIHDELGQVRGPKSDLYDALETATAAQENPLSIVISTQAPNANDLLSVLIDDAINGGDKRTALRFNYAPDELDPFSVEAIKAANPAFDVFMNKAEVLDMQEQARRVPVRQAEFENLVLNRRVETKAPFISKATWSKCGYNVIPFRKDTPVFGGLDLSSVADLTAKVYVSPIEADYFEGKKEDGSDNFVNSMKWNVEADFWLPESGLHDKARMDKVPYVEWHNQGYLKLVPGKTIEYEYVAEQIFQDFKYKNIKKIAFDRYNWKHFKPWLKAVGFKDDEVEGDNSVFVEFGQGYVSMSPALRSIESLILNQKVAHGNNPLLSWCAANAVATNDPAGNRKLDKMKATGRIDGLVAMTMAIAIGETVEIKPKSKPKLIFI